MSPFIIYYERLSFYKLIKIEKHTIEFINIQFNISHSTIKIVMLEFGPRKDKNTLVLN